MSRRVLFEVDPIRELEEEQKKLEIFNRKSEFFNRERFVSIAQQPSLAEYEDKKRIAEAAQVEVARQMMEKKEKIAPLYNVLRKADMALNVLLDIVDSNAAPKNEVDAISFESLEFQLQKHCESVVVGAMLASEDFAQGNQVKFDAAIDVIDKNIDKYLEGTKKSRFAIKGDRREDLISMLREFSSSLNEASKNFLGEIGLRYEDFYSPKINVSPQDEVSNSPQPMASQAVASRSQNKTPDYF